VISELGVALLVDKGSDVKACSLPARFAGESEVVRGEVGEEKRAVAGHIAVQSHPTANI
jgi:hypothetical protein